MATKSQVGKGGNLQTQRNPFYNGPKEVTNPPCLDDISHIGRALEKVLQAGCAIIIGRTRDNGAVVLTILDGDQRHRTYCSNDLELDQAFTAIIDLYD